MRALELKVPPAVLGTLVAFLMWLASREAPAFAFRIPRPLPISTGLAFVGAIIAISGIVSFRRARTTVNPTKPEKASSLVASGIYKFTRNPMYLGFSFVLLAFAVYLSNALALALVPGFVVYLDRFQIRPEERALAARFPSEFQTYRAHVRRWWGRRDHTTR